MGTYQDDALERPSYMLSLAEPRSNQGQPDEMLVLVIVGDS